MGRHHKWTRSYQRLHKEFKARCKAEDAPCWLCGQQTIDYEAAGDDYDNDDRFQLDHYYHASTHPHLFEDPGNFRPSHASCNNDRSDKAARAGLGVVAPDFVLP